MMYVRRVLSANELETFWSDFERLFTKCAENSHDPMTPDEIKQMVLNREGEIFYAVDENDTIVAALAAYPRQTVRGLEYFIVSMSGFDLKGIHDGIFKEICAWMRLSGATGVEAFARLPMCRLLNRYGWETVCTQVHFDL